MSAFSLRGSPRCALTLIINVRAPLRTRARPAKGDCKLIGFEQEGKAVFQGKVKRKKKEHGTVRTEDEAENDAPEDEVEGGGRACRQKGWWKRGDVEAKLNTVNMTAWVHKECDVIEEEALTKLTSYAHNGALRTSSRCREFPSLAH